MKLCPYRFTCTEEEEMCATCMLSVRLSYYTPSDVEIFDGENWTDGEWQTTTQPDYISGTWTS